MSEKKITNKIEFLEELLNKVINSQYEKDTLMGRTKYLDMELYHQWITQTKIFLSNHFSKSSVIYEEFLKQEKRRNAYDTNLAIIKRLKAVFIAAKNEILSNDTVNNKLPDYDPNKVFIVHGHDELSREISARFIEKLDLSPIILKDQASNGETIIEKIESNTDVGFAIIIYTACDLGSAKNNIDNLQPRARQNVVFEHGYLIGKLGRKKVCALVKGDIEKPNDISGLVYIEMDDYGAWRFQLIKEMNSAGYTLDSNKIL